MKILNILIATSLMIMLYTQVVFAQTSSNPVCDSISSSINELNVALTVSAHSPVGNLISRYYFSFGDSTGEQGGGSVNSLSHQYLSSGHYAVYAFVIDNQNLVSDHCNTSFDLIPITPTPTPTPVEIPTSTPTPAPTAIPAPKLTCFVNAYSYGMNVTATVSYLHDVFPVYYYFNFNDGRGDRNYTSNTMTYLYTKPGTYQTTAYVRDALGQSDRCSSDPYIIAAVPTPTPSPCCTAIAQPNRDNRAGNNRGFVVPAVVTHSRSRSGYAFKNAQAIKVANNVKELPKTGLPLEAWALGGLAPLGFGLRKFKSIAPKGNIARYLWEKRKFLKD